ncbi:hypothetical protein ABIE50_002054 [Chitinophaga sp. OAE865]
MLFSDFLNFIFWIFIKIKGDINEHIRLFTLIFYKINTESKKSENNILKIIKISVILLQDNLNRRRRSYSIRTSLRAALLIKV